MEEGIGYHSEREIFLAFAKDYAKGIELDAGVIVSTNFIYI